MRPDNATNSWPCRCCGHRTCTEPPTGWTLQVCDVCGWEDGEKSYESDENRFGNDHALDDAQVFYETDAASSQTWLDSDLLRKPTQAERRPATWLTRVASRAELALVIEDGFADVTLDGGDSLYDAELHDSYGYVGEWLTDEHRHVESRWQDITAEKLALFPNGGPCIFLDSKGLRFYLPAYMRHDLDPSASVDIDTMMYVLAHDDSRHRDLRGVLTAEQTECVCAWLRTFTNDLRHWNNEEATKALELWDPAD